MDQILEITKAPSQKKRKLKAREGQPTPVFRITEKTVWGEKGIWVIPEAIPALELTEEEKEAKKFLVQAQEAIENAEKEKLDRWLENSFNYNENREYVISAQAMADEYNETVRKEGKRKMTAWDAIKFRARYALPAAACHSKGQKFFRGSGKRRQKYEVQRNGSWKKVANA